MDYYEHKMCYVACLKDGDVTCGRFILIAFILFYIVRKIY